jgi:SAM-dependent methyltransferase
LDDGLGRGGEGECGEDDLVSRLESGGHERQPECVEAAPDSDAVAAPAVTRELGLELLDLWAVREGTGADRSLETVEHGAANGVVRRGQIDERNREPAPKDSRRHELSLDNPKRQGPNLRSVPAASIFESFSDVDAAESPESFASLLREMAAVSAVAELKARSFELLQVKRGDRILDVGCGEGTDVERLVELVAPAGEVVGVDRSERLVAAARAMHAGEFVAGDATALPFADNSFDACRADRVVQHLAEPRRAVREMARVVRPGGKVALSEMRFSLTGDEPCLGGQQVLFEALTGKRDQPSWMGNYLPAVLSRVGLSHVRAESAERTVTDPVDAARCLAFDATLAAASAPESSLLLDWRGQFDAALRAGRRALVLHWVAAVGVA